MRMSQLVYQRAHSVVTEDDRILSPNQNFFETENEAFPRELAQRHLAYKCISATLCFVRPLTPHTGLPKCRNST